MSKVRVTVVDGSTEDVPRVGLAQQRMMPTNPSSFFSVWFYVSLHISSCSLFMTGWVLVNSAYSTKTTATTTVRL